MSISPARVIAFDVLRRVATEDAYADDSLRAALDKTVHTPDAGLATELTLGVLRWQRLLDFFIDRNLSKQSKALDIEVRIALRMGVYQLRFLERVPAHAAVHESVELVKRARKRSAAPLVNAVLRKIAKELGPAGAPGNSLSSLLAKETTPSDSLGIKYSHPTWLVERWLRTFGDAQTQALVEANNRVPPLSAYIVDSQHREEALATLAKAGCEVKEGVLLRNAFALQGGNPAASDAVKQGWVAMQDEASQAVAHLLNVAPGDAVLDVCAAPGGKTLILSLAAGHKGHVVAADLRAHRVRAMSTRFACAGVRNVETMELDGSKPLPFETQFARILVDAPCSGTGTLARHPEIRWRLRPEDLLDLHQRQVRLLKNALPALAPGGRLVYSTCSLEPEENEGVVGEALDAVRDNFHAIVDRRSVEAILLNDTLAHRVISDDGFFRTFPPIHHTDGFFAACIERSDRAP